VLSESHKVPRVTKRYEVRPFTADHVDAAAQLLADRHRRHRLACPALNEEYADALNCVPLITELLERDGARGVMVFGDGRPAGYVIFTPKTDATWGPNAWAEDAGNAGETEAIREAYAALAGDLVDAGIRGHWALVPASDAELIEGWFSMSFGVQHAYAFRAPVGADFQPSIGDGLTIRHPERSDIPVMAELDLVLPRHTTGAPVFSTLPVPTQEEAEADLEEDFDNPKYSIWLAEHDGRVIGTLVGVNLEASSSWCPTMRPKSAGFLGYAATLPSGRGLGASRALTDAFFAWARDEGFEWLATDWRSTNIEANRTWRAMGFVPGFLRLYRAIP
jgi:GNAT superfamily N-acetyltransferase